MLTGALLRSCSITRRVNLSLWVLLWQFCSQLVNSPTQLFKALTVCDVLDEVSIPVLHQVFSLQADVASLCASGRRMCPIVQMRSPNFENLMIGFWFWLLVSRFSSYSNELYNKQIIHIFLSTELKAADNCSWCGQKKLRKCVRVKA